MAVTTEAEFKEYVEVLTGGSRGGTCHRPDIACYDVCDDCPYTKYCLCHLNTTLNSRSKRRKLKQL